jgi:hypothetical protein
MVVVIQTIIGQLDGHISCHAAFRSEEGRVVSQLMIRPSAHSACPPGIHDQIPLSAKFLDESRTRQEPIFFINNICVPG